MALAALSGVNEPLFSPSWHRVADLKPRLRGHALVHRHVYRGQVWFVLQDRAASRMHRFTPQAHGIIGLMNGERSVHEIWEAASEVFGDDAPTQDQVIDLLGRLHQADLLATQARPDAGETQRRHDRATRSALGQRFRNPLALRIPLCNPDAALDHLQPLARLLFNPAGALTWLALVLIGLAVAGANAEALVAYASANALSAGNLLMLVLVFPLVKLLHELGHALAVKRWGGQVHEVGVMLLVLAPLPYVDASGAAAFADKRRRIAVSAAGIAVELALAAAAMMFWAVLEPGLCRDVAFNVVLIGSVSTVLFNGNPLLRFDGYYVLADLVDIPNLAQRSNRYLGYLVLRHVFGVAHARSPVTASGEAAWFLVYGICAGIYRVFIAVTIISYVASRFFIIGIVLAIFAAMQMLVAPLLKHLLFLLRSPLLERRRLRAVGLSGALATTLVAAIVAVPAPLATTGEGVVWLPEDARVRTAARGFVRTAHAEPGTRVHAGQVLFELDDPLLDAQVAVLEARISELEVRKAVDAFRDRVKASIFEQQLATLRTELERERERTARLLVRSPADGFLVMPGNADPVGRYVEQGVELATVVDRGALNVRAVVRQSDITLVRERLAHVKVRYADRIGQTLDARLVREVPAAHYLLPSKVLGSAGGGAIRVDPADRRGLKVPQKVFQVELALPDTAPAPRVGQRVHVRFDHGEEPLALQWSRRLKQMFLRGFGA